MINQIKAVMFVQDAGRKAWLGILQKQRCPVIPVTTRNRDAQAQRGRWLFKITRVGGSCAGCPQLCLSLHAVLRWERRGRQNFPNFPGRNRRAREDFLLQLTLCREGSREQSFTCCQGFLLWSCLESDSWTVHWKTKLWVFTPIPLGMEKSDFSFIFWYASELHHISTCDSIRWSCFILPFVRLMSARTPPVGAACCKQKHTSRRVWGLD